jgi:hypothetical protein
MSPQVSYTFTGTYFFKVKLIASIGGSCTDSAVQTVYLINSPVTGVITGNNSDIVSSTQH